jgi:membrane-associated phospholipid phosphatase
MKSLFLSLLSVLFLQTGFSQEPYVLEKKMESTLLSLGGIGLGIDYLLYRELKAIEADEFLALDPSDINAFDRVATTLNASGAGLRSDIGMYLPFVGAGSFILFTSWDKSGNDFWKQSGTLGLIWMETNLINFLLTDMTKNLVQRKRPYVFNPEFQQQSSEFGVNGRKSFYSGHCSFSASNAFFFAKAFGDYYPNSPWKPLVWTLAATIPAWTGIERVLAGKHFPTDVIVGYTFGALCGYFIPHMHLKERRMGVALFPLMGNGFSGLGLVVDL